MVGSPSYAVDRYNQRAINARRSKGSKVAIFVSAVPNHPGWSWEHALSTEACTTIFQIHT